MREILFRGKRKDNGEWIEGYYAKNPYYLPDGFIGGNKEMHIIIPVDAMLYPRCEISRYEEVDPDTVGEFVGSPDKNGKKIFEGDIIKCSILYDIGCYPHITEEIREVKYDGESFSPLHKCCILPEVVGNIHDNPELLEVK